MNIILVLLVRGICVYIHTIESDAEDKDPLKKTGGDPLWSCQVG